LKLRTHQFGGNFEEIEEREINKMANRNTYVPTHDRVRVRRIRKLINVILKNLLSLATSSDSESVLGIETGKEMEADLKFVRTDLLGDDDCIKYGDNYSFRPNSYDLDKLKELEVKYLKAPKEALKGL
tara:strand:+ start:130 stop:513 length:384 start_codon:yes stop_codon:yes gene_type:complete